MNGRSESEWKKRNTTWLWMQWKVRKVRLYQINTLPVDWRQHVLLFRMWIHFQMASMRRTIDEAGDTFFFFWTKTKYFFTKIVLSNRQFHSDANNLKDRLFSLDLEFRRAGISFILIENYHLKPTANTHFLDCCTVLSIAIPFSIAALRFLLYLKNKQLHTNFCEWASTMLKLAKLSRQ